MVSIVPLITAGFLTYSYAYNTIKWEVINNLNIIANRKAHEIKDYIEEKTKDAIDLSETQKIKNYFKNYKIFKSQNNKLNYSFGNFVEKEKSDFGFDNIILLSVDGSIIYSDKLKREKGHLSIDSEDSLNSNFLSIFNHVKKQGTSEIVTFQYVGFLNKIIESILTPVLVNGKIIGVQVAVLNTNKLLALASDTVRLGKTGKTILAVKKDSTIVFEILPTDRYKKTFKNKVLIGSNKAIALQKAVSKEYGFGISVDYTGKNVFSSWHDVPSANFALVVQVDEAEAFSPVYKIRDWILGILLFSFFGVFYIALIVSRKITKPIGILTNFSKEITDYNFNIDTKINASGEIKILAEAFTEMKTELHTAIVNRDEEIAERKQAESLLSESEKRFRSIFENSVLGIYLTTPQGKIVMANPALIKMLGFSSFDELAKRNLEEEPHYAGYLRSKFKEQLEREGKITNYESSWIKENGDILYIAENAQVVKDGSGNVLYYEGTVEDITKRKHAENALNENRKRFKVLFEQSSDAILLWKDGAFIDCNNKTLEMFKCTRQQILSTPLYDFSPLFQPDGRSSKDKAFQYINDALNEGPQSFEWKHKKFDGTLFDAEIILKAVDLPSGKFIHAIVRNITEKKKIEAALIESEKKYRAFFNSSLTPFILTTGNGDIIDGNPAAVKLFGFNSLDEAKKYNTSSFYCDVSERDQLMKFLKKKRKIIGHEIKLKKINGETINVVLNVIGEFDEVDNLLFLRVYLRDLTEQKKAENKVIAYQEHLEDLVLKRTENLKRVNERLLEAVSKQKAAEMKAVIAYEKEKELVEMKSRFISTVSHEFRTPLTTISSSIGLLEIFREKGNMQKYSRHVVKIENSAKYLAELVEDILALNRAETDEVEFEPENLNLYMLANMVFEEICQTTDEEHQCVFDYKLNKKELILLDRIMVKLILSNLFSNAIKYSPNGGKIIVNIYEEKGFLCIKISDEGVGILEEDQKRIFQKFYRVDNDLDVRGNGLGLALVKKAVELHGGQIKCESQLNKGTVFTVTIPIIKGELQ